MTLNLKRIFLFLTSICESKEVQSSGIPSVALIADKLHFFAKYFSDLKKETGKIAQEFIQLKLIDAAKEKIFDTNKSVSEDVYKLGFKYPQPFTP